MSTLRVNAIQNTSGVQMYLARAWVNFDGTGTVAIRASGNVSSITDNGTGDYTVNFTNALADANYSVVAINGNTGTSLSDGHCGILGDSNTSTQARIGTGKYYTAGQQDRQYVSVAIFR